MNYTLEIDGPRGYGFTQMALPAHLRGKPYTVLSHNFIPDGGTYAVGKEYPGMFDIPYTEIPTGKSIWELRFD